MNHFPRRAGATRLFHYTRRRAAGQGGSVLPYVTDLHKARNEVDAIHRNKKRLGRVDSWLREGEKGKILSIPVKSVSGRQIRGVEPPGREGAYFRT